MKRSQALLLLAAAVLGGAWFAADGALAALDTQPGRQAATPAGAEQRDVQAYPIAGPAVLDVTAGRAAVSVEGWDRDTIEMVVTRRVGGGVFPCVGEGTWTSRAETRKLLDSVAVHADAVDNALRVRVLEDELHAAPDLSVHIAFKAPRETALRLESGDGALRVEGVRSGVELRTGNGAIVAEDIAGDVRAASGNGRILLARISGSAHARTENGAIETEALEGVADLKSTNGAIVATGAGAHSLRCHTANGGIRVAVDNAAPCNLDLRTEQGGVDCALSLDQPFERQGNALRGFLRGGGAMIALSSGNGNIHVGEG
ncbi:MAG: hypothetical protein RLZZ303_639 [Candidatus Hydrogenedentota bacterium]|jgi:hypothetical protein